MASHYKAIMDIQRILQKQAQGQPLSPDEQALLAVVTRMQQQPQMPAQQPRLGLLDAIGQMIPTKTPMRPDAPTMTAGIRG